MLVAVLVVSAARPLQLKPGAAIQGSAVAYTTLAALSTLALVGLRAYVHRLEDKFKAQRLGSLAWTVLAVLTLTLDVYWNIVL